MSFDVNKAIAAEPDMEVKIPLTVNVTYEAEKDSENSKPEADETVDVIHIFRLPEKKEREKHQQLMVKVRGQNVKALGSTNANFWLWSQCMKRLEGYTGLPETREQIIKLFENSTILHIHAESAATALLSHISASEGEISKN